MRTSVQPATETIDAMTMILDVLETQPTFYTENAEPTYEVGIRNRSHTIRHKF
jgi:hypothetical protein